MVDLTESLHLIVKRAVSEALAEAGVVREIKDPTPRAGRDGFSQAELARAIGRTPECVRLLRHFGFVQSVEVGARVRIPAAELQRLQRDGIPKITRAMRLQAKLSAEGAVAAEREPTARIGRRTTRRGGEPSPIFPQPGAGAD